MGLVSNIKPARETFKPYDEEDRALLSKKYTPAQIRAIEAGEQAIDPEDLQSRGVIRSDMGTLPYLDDLSHTRPMLDRPQTYEGPIDPNSRLLTREEFSEAYADTMGALEDTEGELSDPHRGDFLRELKEVPSFMGTHGPIPAYQTPDYRAPGLPWNFDPDNPTSKAKKETEKDPEDDVDPRDPDGIYNRLIKQTGLTLDQILDYKIKILVKHRVVNQTRLGKVSSIYCLAVAGNGNGRLGIGEAKGQEIEETQTNARIAAIRSMQPIPRYEERTIFGEVDGKVSAVEVKLMARPPGKSPSVSHKRPLNLTYIGFGLRCQHLIFEMSRAAGIHDLAARVPRSRNGMNTVKAAYQAFMKQRIPDEIARARGKKLVDVRKVYYGGRV
jgi:small subunit ribosomal protein S5